ncbi:MAG: ATP-dependent DNA helicase, partial [Ruthenibacterium sp.]
MQEIALSVRELVTFVLRRGSIDSRFTGFDRALEGARIHRKLQKAAGDAYKPEVAMKATRVVDDILYRLDGRADGVIAEADGIVLDEIKTSAAPKELLQNENFNPLHWAQAQCYAAIACADFALDTITVQLTYYQIDTDEVIYHRRHFTAAQLESFLTDTLRLYTPWAQLAQHWRTVRNASIAALSFPFAQYRDGQYRLAGAVYKTIAAGGRLFAAAPTGIGKTISTLFPAIKAMGEEKGERIFFLTAKTITRQAAEDALFRLREKSGGALRLKSVTLTAKDKICLLDERSCTPEACPYANGYYDRINDALYAFLQERDCFTRDDILAFAKERQLCPFELSLDLTNFCDCILCDYNYLFDPVVRLKRFFEEGGDFIFLVDEAHNLVSRARDMYSARLDKSSFFAVKRALGKTPRRLAAALTKLNSAFIELRRKAQDAQTTQLVTAEGDKNFAKLLTAFTVEAQSWLDEHRDGPFHAEMLQLYFDARFYLRIFELYDTHFVTLTSLRGNEVSCELLCLDASPFLDASMALGRASILFSATLTPSDYFIRTLGGGDGAKRTLLQSPFPAEHFCLLCADTISTKYADRARTLPQLVQLIYTAVTAKKGNYLVFFPSYQYLQDAVALLKTQYPDMPITVQESRMDEAAREAFLAQFS